MLQFNNNHIFTGYLKQFLASFNLPTCKIYTAEFKKFFAEHGYEDPRVIESNSPIIVSTDKKVRPATSITYLRDGCAQQYFWDTSAWQANQDISANTVVKYWKSHKTVHYHGNKIFGLTKTLQNPTTLYNYQTHEYLGDYLRFLRDYENINLMSMYNCFSNRLCNNLKIKLDWTISSNEVNPQTLQIEQKTKNVSVSLNSYDTRYKIYMLPVKLFENYTIAIDCYQGVELFCGLYNEQLDTSTKAKNLIKKTYVKIPKTLFNQPFLYDKLDVKHWNWTDENTVTTISNDNTIARSLVTIIPSTTSDTENSFTRAEIATRESELMLFIKVPATNTSSIAVLAGDYRNFNDTLYTLTEKSGWQYINNSTVANFETNKTNKDTTLPELNSREFKPISKLQLLALNTGISYPFADRLMEYLVANVIVPNDATSDNIRRLQKVMEDCGYNFQVEGAWEPKMQMILYDYLMNSGKFAAVEVPVENNNYVAKRGDRPNYKVVDKRAGNLRQRGQGLQADFYDILGYGDKDAEKLYASWMVDKDGKITAKNTLENVDIYSNLYNN